METKIDVYVQSRGLTQDHDYRWLKIETNHQTPTIPDILKGSLYADGKSIVPVDLIDSQKFSIVLLHWSNQLTLLITGLKSGEERVDFAGRAIRNSILIQGRYGYEKKFRGILIRALTEQLDLDEIVTSGGDYGFIVNHKALLDLAKSEDLQFDNPGNHTHIDKIAKNTPKNRQKLALELKQNQLPNREGLLIVVTSLKTGSVLEKMGVWRGLSNRIESETWIEYKTREIPKSSVSSLNKMSVTPHPSQVKKGGLILLLILLLLILVVIVAQSLQTTPPSQQEIQFPPETPSLETPTTPREIEIQPETETNPTPELSPNPVPETQPTPTPTIDETETNSTPETQPETWKTPTPTTNETQTNPTLETPPETLPTNGEDSPEKSES